MAIPQNIDRAKTIANIRKEFPKRRKPENIAKVIFASLSLGALDLETSRKSWELISEGATAYGISVSVKLEILNIKKFRGSPFFQYHRPVPKPKTNLERENALKYERKLLYKHLSEEADALIKVVEFLKLEQDSELADVKVAMEDGDLYKQIKTYDDVFKLALGEEGWHNDTYDYYWMGYRRKSARYWLTSKGLKLVVRKS